MAKHQDILGKHYDRLKVTVDTERSDGNGNRIWLCQCECGGSKEVTTHDLNHGLVTSCGCLYDETVSENGKRNIRKLIDKNCKDGTNIGNLDAKISKTNTSGIKGVTWDSAKINGKHKLDFGGRLFF